MVGFVQWDAEFKVDGHCCDVSVVLLYCCIVVCIGFANPRLLDLWLEKKALW